MIRSGRILLQDIQTRSLSVTMSMSMTESMTDSLCIARSRKGEASSDISMNTTT